MGDAKVICRFCLNDDNAIEYFNVFDDVSSDFNIKIKNCLSIQLIQNDGLPIFGCLDCIQKINQFDHFKKMCCDSYKYLVVSKQIEYKKDMSLGKSVNSSICTDNINNAQQLEEIENDHYSNESESEDEYNYSEYQGDTTNEDKLNKHEKQINFNEVDDSVLNIIGNNIYICDICEMKTDSFMQYYEHQEIHDGASVFKCDKCSLIFNQRRLLVEHDSKHRVTCTICNIEVLPKSLKAHLLIHTDTHRCSMCNMRHTSKASLEKHIQARHIGTKGFVCHICGKQSSCQSSINRHMAYHSNDRPYKCQYCDFSAKSLNILQVHSSRKHFAEKCVCEICAKMFKSQPSLVQHMKRIHSNRKHVCGICDKVFIEKYNLNKHMKKHVGQRLHECKVCHKEFFTVRKLKEHMHSHRQGCVNCPKCGKEFIYKKYFNKHVIKCNGVQKTDTVELIQCKIKNELLLYVFGFLFV